MLMCMSLTRELMLYIARLKCHMLLRWSINIGVLTPIIEIFMVEPSLELTLLTVLP